MDSALGDRFRQFAEEADLLQGVQLSLDLSTGFGAMGSEMVCEIMEDHPKGDVLALGLMGRLDGHSGPEETGASLIAVRRSSSRLSHTRSEHVLTRRSDGRPSSPKARP